MATLTGGDFTIYKKFIRRDPVARAEMRTATPAKSDWYAMMQAIEDYFEMGRAVRKVAAEKASGLKISDTLWQKLEKVWMSQKHRSE